MDKIDAFYELEKLYEDMKLNYDFSIKINGHFKINIDTANNWIKKWIEKEFLQRIDDKQIRNVDYVLTEKYLKNLE